MNVCICLWVMIIYIIVRLLLVVIIIIIIYIVINSICCYIGIGINILFGLVFVELFFFILRILFMNVFCFF